MPAMIGLSKRCLGSSCVLGQCLQFTYVFELSGKIFMPLKFFVLNLTMVVFISRLYFFFFCQENFSPWICAKLLFCNCTDIKDRSRERHRLDFSGLLIKRVSKLVTLNINMGRNSLNRTFSLVFLRN